MQMFKIIVFNIVLFISSASFGENITYIEKLINDANKGDVDAQWTLAHEYMSEESSLGKDDKKVRYWLNLAANQEDLKSMQLLGIIYIKGLFGEPDICKGEKLLRKVVEKTGDNKIYEFYMHNNQCKELKVTPTP